MIGLHEADASYEKNPMRGAQFYPNCVQIEIVGNGTVELPSGVSFPGAYKYSDPGVVYDVRQFFCYRAWTASANVCRQDLLFYQDQAHSSVHLQLGRNVPHSR